MDADEEMSLDSGTNDLAHGTDTEVAHTSQLPSIISLAYDKYEVKSDHGRKITSAVCKLCPSLKVKEKDATTSNYLRHTRTKHPELFQEYKQRQQTPTSQRTLLDYVGAGVKKYKSTDSKQKELTRMAINAIIAANLPLSVVENQEFRVWVNTLNPKYSLPSRPTVVSKISDRYSAVKEKLSAMLSSKTVAVTLDLWTDRVMRGFLGVTAHFVEQNVLHSALLTCTHFEGSHSGKNIFEAFESCISDFNITVDYAITDNASSMKKAFDYYDLEPSDVADQEEDANESQSEDLNLITTLTTRLSCFAHSLQLCVTDGLKANKGMSGALAKTSKLSSMIHSSAKFKTAFDKAFNADGGHRGVPQPVVTRWNSSLRQVKAVLALTNVKLNTFLEGNGFINLKISGREWSQLEEMCTLLQPFAEATDKTQGDKVVTISYVLPCILALQQHLSTVGLIHLRSVRDALRRSLERRFSGLFKKLDGSLVKEPFSDDIYVISTVLDPNWGLSWITTWREESYDYLAEFVKDLVLAQTRGLMDESGAAVEDVTVVEEATEVSDTAPTSSSLFAKVKRKRTSVAANTDTQYHRYIMSVNELTGELCPFKFWADHKQAYPTLAKYALNILKVPASSAPVERVFSQGSIVMRPHRSTLGVGNLEKIVFLKCNNNI